MSTPTQFQDEPSTLDAMEEAFNSVWSTLYAHVTPDNSQSEELRSQLSQTLVALASDGITDQMSCVAKRWRAWHSASDK